MCSVECNLSDGANMNKSAEFWIEQLNLVEHPGEEDGFFAVPFEDSFTVINRNKVQNQTRC